jgi:hypothetical protein
MNNYMWLWFIASLFFIHGCAGARVQCPYYYTDIVPKLDLKNVLSSVADELSCKSTFTEINSGQNERCRPLSGTILITDFVDLHTLKPEKTGVLMGEMMKSRLFASAGILMSQVEFSKYFTLSPQGLIGLTRNQQEIRNDEFVNSECIVGTYSLAPERLYLFVRRIDMKTGKIVRMADREISWSCYRSSGSLLNIWSDDNTSTSISTSVR